MTVRAATSDDTSSGTLLRSCRMGEAPAPNGAELRDRRCERLSGRRYLLENVFVAEAIADCFMAARPDSTKSALNPDRD